MTHTAAHKSLEQQISKLAGVPVEMTIRGERSFTFSTEERNEQAADRIAAFFKGQAKAEIVHDDEVGSFVYVEA